MVYWTFWKGEIGTIIAILTFIILLIGIAIKAIKLFTRPTKVKIEFDKKQSIISKIASHEHAINDNCCTLFYFLKVIGLKKNATSIKDIKFYIKSKRKWIEGINFKIKIKYIEDKNGKSVPSIVTGNSKAKIVILNWFELSEIYNKRIEYGEVLLGSASYYFHLSHQELLQASKMKFIITDNFKRKYISKCKMELFDALEKSIYVLDYDVDLNQ